METWNYAAIIGSSTLIGALIAFCAHAIRIGVRAIRVARKKPPINT